MTTPTITPNETIRFAGAVLHTMLPALETSPAALPAIVAAWRLNRALEDHCQIATGETCWEMFYPELAGEADPHEAALAKAAQETGALAEALIAAMAAVIDGEDLAAIAAEGGK